MSSKTDQLYNPKKTQEKLRAFCQSIHAVSKCLPTLLNRYCVLFSIKFEGSPIFQSVFCSLIFYGYPLNGSRRSSFYSSLLLAISIYNTTSSDVSFLLKILHKQEKFWLPKNSLYLNAELKPNLIFEIYCRLHSLPF